MLQVKPAALRAGSAYGHPVEPFSGWSGLDTRSGAQEMFSDRSEVKFHRARRRPAMVFDPGPFASGLLLRVRFHLTANSSQANLHDVHGSVHQLCYFKT